MKVVKQLIDYHTHSRRCGHAEGTVQDYVRAAVDRGLCEIGISDHFPMQVLGFSGGDVCSMPPEQLSCYISEVRQSRRRWGSEIEVRLGTEVDYVPRMQSTIDTIAGMKHWDYIIGSVHFIGEVDITHPKNEEFFESRNIMDIYTEYFDLVRMMVCSGSFDVIGHIDAVKKMGCVPSGDHTDQLVKLYGEMARLLASHDQVVEINTGGLRAPVGEWYPSPDLLRRLCEAGVRLTVGSDAHAPAEVGQDVDQVIRTLKHMGVGSIVGFRRRRPYEIALQ